MNVLLLHAGIADRRMWAPQIEALEAAGHRVLAPDLPGFGDNALTPPTVDYVEFAAGLLDGAASFASFLSIRRSSVSGLRPSSAARSAAVSRSSWPPRRPSS